MMVTAVNQGNFDIGRCQCTGSSQASKAASEYHNMRHIQSSIREKRNNQYLKTHFIITE
jgi:hypothetical protein